MSKLLVWGAGGHAAVVADAARLSGWTVAAFVDDSANRNSGGVWAGAPVVGVVEAELLVRDGIAHAAAAIGNPTIRLAKAAVLDAWGCALPPIVHPRATVAASAILGPGTVVCAGAVVQPMAEVGRLAVVNTLASVDHECYLAEAVHLCPGARLAGLVRVERGGWIGIGASVRDRVRLGEWCFVGAGAAVVSDLPSGCLAVGVPARVCGLSPYRSPATPA